MKLNLVLGLFSGFMVLAGSFLSRRNGWYFDYWYTDIILHIIAGIMFGFLWLLLVRKTEFRPVWLITLGAVAMAVFGSFLWEVWEMTGWRLRPDQARFYIPEIADSLSDITCGMIGGFFSAISNLFRKK